MHQDPLFADVIAMCLSGRFRAARERLMGRKQELEHVDGFLFSALLSDLDLQSGDLSTSRSSAEITPRKWSVSIKAIAHRILAEASASLLEFEDSISHYHSARALCREGVLTGLLQTSKSDSAVGPPVCFRWRLLRWSSYRFENRC